MRSEWKIILHINWWLLYNAICYTLYLIQADVLIIIGWKLHFSCWTLFERELLSLFYSIVAWLRCGLPFFRFVCYYIYRKMHLGISQWNEGICLVHETSYMIFVMLQAIRRRRKKNKFKFETIFFFLGLLFKDRHSKGYLYVTTTYMHEPKVNESQMSKDKMEFHTNYK